jgi:hypothetical protein
MKEVQQLHLSTIKWIEKQCRYRTYVVRHFVSDIFHYARFHSSAAANEQY